MKRVLNFVKTNLISVINFIKYLLNSKRAIFYVGGFPNIPNLGDVALYDAYKAFFPKYKLIPFRGNLLERIFYKGNKSLSVMGGGTLINRLCLYEATSAHSTFENFAVLGTGVAQDSYWAEKREESQLPKWKPILEKAQFLGVRGPLSQSQLASYDLKAQVFYDPVLFLQNKDSLKNQATKKLIGLNIGQSSGNVWGGEDSLAKKFTELANHFISLGYQIKWFVVCPEDLPMTELVAKETNTQDSIICEYYDYKKFYDLSKDIDIFIGIKLHAIVLALCNSIPSLMVEYRPKCLDFMKSIDLEDYSIRADKLDLSNIDSFLEKLNSQSREDIFNKIREKAEFQKETLSKIF